MTDFNSKDDAHKNAADSAQPILGTPVGDGYSVLVDPQGNPYSHKTNPYQSLKRKAGNFLRKIEHGDRMMIALTAIIAFSTIGQIAISAWNNWSTGKQTEKLIVAAHRMDDAADRFASSAAHINSGISDAVAEMHSQAAIAGDMFKSQQNVFEVDQRPYIIATTPIFVGGPPKANGPIRANLILRNIGHSPAQNYVSAADFYAIKGKTFPARKEYMAYMNSHFAGVYREEAKTRRILAGTNSQRDLAPNDSGFSTSKPDLILPQKDIDSMLKQEVQIFYIGFVTYYDSFHKRYETQFCFFHTGDSPTVWNFCDSHNTIK